MSDVSRSELRHDYALYLEENGVMPSPLLAYLQPEAPRPSLFDLRERLRRHPRVTQVGDVQPPDDGHLGTFAFVVGDGDTALDFQLFLEANSGLDTRGVLGDVTAEDTERAAKSPWCIVLETYLSTTVLEDFHTQVRLLHHLVPDPVLVYDCASFRAHSGAWLADTARAAVPPPPQTLYTIHALHGDGEDAPDGDPGPDDPLWLHSHGLHRCGSIELEMVGLRQRDRQTFSTLFDTVAALFIEHGPVPPNEPFEVGQDLELMWVRWEDAVPDLAATSPGGQNDRDEVHREPAGVLFVAHESRRTGVVVPKSLRSIRRVLQDEPLLYLSSAETRRMSLLAKERFRDFRTLQRRFGEHEEWFFKVKMGYQVDDCPDDADENEHLWFDVHEIRAGQVRATLLNQPFSIARMREGDTDDHALDQLSDWSIDSPHGHFDASTVGRLMDLIEGM